MALLHEAALEARALYAGLFDADAPMPANDPLPPRGAYVIAYVDDKPLACGALRPLGDTTAELRRMYVLGSARRHGVGRALLVSLEQRARELGYDTLRLETGNRQQAAMALYESFGFQRIAAFGSHVGDPTSMCYEKRIDRQP